MSGVELMSKLDMLIEAAQKTENTEQAKTLVKEAHDDIAELARRALKNHADCPGWEIDPCVVKTNKKLETKPAPAAAVKVEKVKPVPDVNQHIRNIAKKVPMLDALEKKLGMMNSIHPELKQIASDLDDITNFDDMRAAKKGGELIKKTLQKRAKEDHEFEDEVVHVHHIHSVNHVVHHHHFPGASKPEPSPAVAAAKNAVKKIKEKAKTMDPAVGK